MNYHQYYPVDIVNGPGTRCTLFVSGCGSRVPRLLQISTATRISGMPFTAEMEDRIINDLNDTRIKRQIRSPAATRPSANVPDMLKLVNAPTTSAGKKISGSGRAISWMN